MEGAALAAKRRLESETATAWQTAAFGAAAFAGKLKKLNHYLPQKPVKPQTPQEMIAILQELRDRGAPMNIRRVN
jgi:hypothetical protein